MAKILTFYQNGTGSSHYTVERKQPILSEDDWARIQHVGIALLRKRGHSLAADILETGNLKICVGVNDFRDDFNVLYRQVGLDEYVSFDERSRSTEYRDACHQLATALSEIGHQVRFVGVELAADDSPQPVTTPRPKFTSSAVEQALGDAEHLVSQNRPVSAVDRAHTALHGYLKQICADSNLVVQSTDPSLTESVKTLIKLHPKFANNGPQKDQVEKVFRGMSSICDALNPIRNHGSLAHANETLLEPAEAMLAINASRTLLHYVDQKLQ